VGLLGETVRLTHYGRNSGKPFDVTIWFTTIDGTTWIGSMNDDRNWVRNVRANGKVTLDFGSGPRPMRATWIRDAIDVARYDEAIVAKYPFWSRVIGALVRGEHCAFRLESDGASH
jgi:deazaflavin-dependent oxidoreductase (nitroreductase family)